MFLDMKQGTVNCTVVAKMIRTLVFLTAKSCFKSVILSFVVVCQWEISVYFSNH